MWTIYNYTYNVPEIHDNMPTSWVTYYVADYSWAEPGKVYALNGEEKIRWDKETDWIVKETVA
jgi:hypothetical protein